MRRSAAAVTEPDSATESRTRGGLSRRALALCSGAGIALGCDYVAWACSIFRVGAGVSTVLINVQVIVLPTLAWLVRRERVRGRFLIALPGVGLGLGLVAGLVGAGHRANGDGIGIALALLAGMGYGVYLFLSAEAASRGAGAVQSLTISTAAAALTALTAVPFAGGARLASVSSRGWMLMAALALLGQVLSWLLIHRGGARLPSSTTGLLLLVQPPMAMLLAHLFLGEWVSLWQGLGVGIVVLGIAASVATG